MANSKSVVIAALVANAAIAALKFGGFLLTGSAAMLSETYHSVSDTGNQIFLLIGLRYSEREANRQHPFGYGKAQFFYSLLVSVLLFGIAGWESLRKGYESLVHHEAHLVLGTVDVAGVTVPGIAVNYAILIGAIGFEGYAWRKAQRSMEDEIESHGWSGFYEAFRKTSEVSTLTALTEDTIAISGLGIALVGLTLTYLTGNPVFDGLAALLIGLALMSFAVALAWENKRLLLGESLPASEEDALRAVVAEWPTVRRVRDFRTVYFGPDRLLVTADVAFDADLDTAEIDREISTIERHLQDENDAVKKVYIEPEAEHPRQPI
ncbi:MAG: cation diffusion facilitator family transporter [Haloarculaceae archaeon]